MDQEAKIRVTFEEYDALPETNQIVELIDGEIIASPPLDIRHQKALRQIVKLPYCRLTGNGEFCIVPTGLHFDDGSSFEPDLFWVSADNDHCFLEDNGRYWHGAPDLVIEILSPTTASNDRGVKFEMYEQHGVREYWMVDPDANYVEIYRLEGDKFERQGLFKPNQPFTSTVLGGATIDSKSWFSEADSD